jgi:GAF domain-containing protein/two-component sensor histidine kinase
MKKLGQFLRDNNLLDGFHLSEVQKEELTAVIEDKYLVWFLTDIIRQAEEIMAIDPRLEQKHILEVAAKKIVRNLDAGAATIRLFDQESLRMTSFGTYGVPDYERLASVPVQNSISGRVVQERKAVIVPNILKDPLYQHKKNIQNRGFHSLLAVPLLLPNYMGGQSDLLGTLQIYYKEEDREFDDLEIIHAELLARRVSYVLAKKKILDLQELNDRKEKIVNKIFIKLSMREGIKLKNLFFSLIPELGEFLKIQSCALYTVSDDQQFIHLEAAYPMELTYHDIGHTFTVSHHPYFETAVMGHGPFGDHPFERITPNYILIKSPLESSLLSKGLKEFIKEHQVHSLLSVPLKVDNKVRHLLIFYATQRRQYFTDEEIELLIFFGKEIMKATKLEFFSDVLHDFKNPAIAVAGFANRAKKLLASDSLESVRQKLTTYIDIMATEAARLQDLALTMSGEGREEVLDFSSIVRQRYQINEEVAREMKQANITVKPPVLEENLFVFCPRFALERVLDNLFNNALKAVPKEGGMISVRAFRQGAMACLEVINSGEIPSDKIEQVRAGQVKGRGLNIIFRFVTANHGNIEITTEDGSTKFIIKLPYADVMGLGL